MGAYDELDKFQTEEGRKIVSDFVAKALADEQQPADVVTAEQQQDGAAGRALGELATTWLGWFDGDQDDEPPFFPERRSEIADHLRELRAVLAERTALAARVAELEAHPAQMVRADREADEADVRAVAALLKLGDVSFRGTWLTDWDDAKSTLAARFADRIEALDADTDGGAE